MTPKPPSAAQFALGVVILAAGASSRMGRPKLLLPWGDTSVVGHLIRQWQELGAEQIVIVCRAGDAPMAAELDRLSVPLSHRIANPQPERGMFSSVVCAANWDGWNASLSVWAIVLGDQPHLRRDTLRGLIEDQRAHPEAICQPVQEAHRRHPVLLPRAAFHELRDSRASSLKEFLEEKPRAFFESRTNDRGLSLDLDRPEDYERALAIYQT
jgi:molybdenum cofactor cytidylyltransferase